VCEISLVLLYTWYMPAEYSVLLICLAVVAFVPFVSQAFVPRLKDQPDRSTVVESGRSGFFDLIRGVAILGVVVIHITYLLTPYVTDFAPLNDVVNNLLRFALPVFFVSSGVLLTAPQWNVRWLSAFFQRRFVALGIPYVLVTVALSWYHEAGLAEVWYNLWTGNAGVPLYFVPVLFQLYVLYPFIYSLAQRQWFVWVTLIISIVAYLEPALRFYQDLSYATPYVFFFAWGIYMRQWFLQKQSSGPLLIWSLIILMFVGLQFYFGLERYYNGQYFYGIAVIMALWWLYQKDYISARLSQWSEFIGQRSLWIFLTHFTWLQVVLYFTVGVNESPTPREILLFVVCGLVGSLGLGVVCHFLYEKISRTIALLRK